MVPELETNLVNAVLTNGARYYVDHAHPEISSPRPPALEAVQLRPGGRGDRPPLMVAASNVQLGNGAARHEMVVHKNNSDGKCNSYGCHENYLLSRRRRSGASPPRSPLTSSPARSCAAPARSAASCPAPRRQRAFQLSQRADFFEEEVGLETTLKRPIVNTATNRTATPRSTGAST